MVTYVEMTWKSRPVAIRAHSEVRNLIPTVAPPSGEYAHSSAVHVTWGTVTGYEESPVWWRGVFPDTWMDVEHHGVHYRVRARDLIWDVESSSRSTFLYVPDRVAAYWNAS